MDYQQLLKDIFTLNFKPFKVRYYKLTSILKRKIKGVPKLISEKDFKSVPIIINNCNRYTYLLQLIGWLEKNGYSNIFIIDNNSSYPPLLEYYKTINYKVFYLSENVGHLSLWKTGIIKQFEDGYYVYTDPDVVPVKDCPSNVIEYFYMLLTTHSNVEKVGFGLKIDDLPESYSEKNKVIEWETKYWRNEIEKDVFDAQVDTTFALYKPFTNGIHYMQNALRTGGKYQLHHLPWYEDSQHPTEENLFYKNNIKKGASHWIIKEVN